MPDQLAYNGDKAALIRAALRAAADTERPEIAPPKQEAGPCPRCESDNIRTRLDAQAFEYGSGKDATILTAAVPVRVCQACAFEYLDTDAEDARHLAICGHLGMLPPDEVRATRQKYGKNRSEFARITGLGEASLGRWESGALIQNTAYDRYLRLLGNPANFRELESQASARDATTAARCRSPRRTRALSNVEVVRSRGAEFRPCRSRPAGDLRVR
jgi:putative zinc finger/helix-turn-helix YgiT family protein